MEKQSLRMKTGTYFSEVEEAAAPIERCFPKGLAEPTGKLEQQRAGTDRRNLRRLTGKAGAR